MNAKSKKVIFGLLSSVLLGVGLARAAERFDTLNPQRLLITQERDTALNGSAVNCSSVCDAVVSNSAANCSGVCDAVIGRR